MTDSPGTNLRITQGWVTAPGPQAVIQALGEAYFVGGCVRNALLGAPITDIDIATPLLPEEAANRLTDAGIKTVATGLQHGTQTAVWEGEGIEVTTFRTDIATDGRHAVVRYTTDLATDAARRDFTINALYAAADGQVIDPLGALPDLKTRRLRFIGRPEDRIKEDYLRILRFFRFHAWYGSDGLDPDGLAACAGLADGLRTLARERIGWEFRKLLSAPDPVPAMASMAASGVLLRCLPAADPSLLAPLIHAEGLAGVAPGWLTRLSAIGGDEPENRLRLSRAEATALTRINAARLDMTPVDVQAYRHGADAAIAANLIKAAATSMAPEDDLQSKATLGAAKTFPLTARDLLNHGLEPGPALGQALAHAEQVWLDHRFRLDKSALAAAAISGHKR